MTAVMYMLVHMLARHAATEVFLCPAGEMQWIHPQMEHSLVWDASIGAEGDRLQELTQHLTRSLTGALLPAQQQQVKSTFKQDPGIKWHFACLYGANASE